MLALVLASVMAVSVQDYLEGAEVGDATQYVAFQTGGKYVGERTDKAGKTTLKGTWKITGTKLEVKVTSCKGPACSTFGRSWSGEVAVVAERAMTVKASHADAPMSTGSYYCRSQGCEKRIGVELVSHRQRVDVMRNLLAYLIDKNRTRDVTVVWIGDQKMPPQAKSSISFCEREKDRAKKGAELVAADLGSLAWFGKTTPTAAGTECLFDVRVVIGDDVQPPSSP